MTKLEVYLTHPLAETVGWALLHSLWQGALVALLFAGGLVLARRRSPQLRYLLGRGALVLLVAAPVGTGAFLYGRAEPPVQARVGLDADPLPTVVQSESVQGESRDESMSPATPAQPAAPTSLATSSVTALGARALELLRTAAPWLTGVWLLGVVLFLLRFSGQALYINRFRARHRTPADAHWQARARALATRLGVRRSWRLVSGYAESPLTVGVLRPLIVLPTSALTGMPAAQLEALLAHELAHIRRHDYLVNLFQCVAEALMFYHPAVWWVSSTVRRAREECCDDLAVEVCGDAKLYARALTNLEALRQPPALALAATDKPLLARVRRLLGLGEVRHTPPLTTGVLLLSMVAITAILSFAPQPAAAQNVDESDIQGSLWVSVSSRVVFDNDYTRISELVTPAPYVLVEERTATERRTVRVTRGASDTDFVYTYTVDGVVRPFSAPARAWFDASLQAAVLEPLKEDATKKARGTERKDFHLVSHLDYDSEANRYISFALAEDAHLEPSTMATVEISLGKRNLLSQVTHYAAHNLVSDRETGDYLKLFIEHSRPTQLEVLTPDIMSTVAELEDEAVKADVKQALATRLQNTAEQKERVVGQTTAQEAPTASPTAPEAPKQVSRLKGAVVWNDKRVANIKVELREEPGDDEVVMWDTLPALQTTETNARGEYAFENVPPGNYVVWARGNEEIYQIAGYPAYVYAETSGYDVIHLEKIIETTSPVGTAVKTLTPTLRWKPVPGAVRYEVGVDDLTSSEDPLAIRRYYRTDTPNLELPEPLQRNRFYRWSVAAYTENGTQIASAYEPMFSTGRPKTSRPVKVHGISVSTVLPTDWQQTSPGVFEYVGAKGEMSLTFEKRSRADLEAGLEERALASLRRFPQQYADRNWGSSPVEGSSAKLVTVENGTAYLITVDGLALTDEEPTFPTMELFVIVLPTMLRNFKIDEP